MRGHCVARLFFVVACCVSCASAVELMAIIRRRLLGLTDGGGVGEEQPMRVIGAGFGRTGTESLCAALTRIGFKTYHGTKAVRHGHLPQWNAWYDRGDPRIFGSLRAEGFNATTDFPASLAYTEFLRLHPAAKVVLSLHPGGAEGWARSFLKVRIPCVGLARGTCDPRSLFTMRRP